MAATFEIEMIGDGYVHSTPDTNISSRTGQVLKKGTRWTCWGEKNGMYAVGNNQYVSKSLARKATSTTDNSGGVDTRSDTTTPKAPASYDWVIAMGAGFLFLMLIGKVVRKL